MSRRIIKIMPTLLVDMLTVGYTVGGKGEQITTVGGLPEGAKFLRVWHDANAPGDGMIALLFEHDSWPEVAEGALYPVIDVMFQRTKS